MLRLTVSSITNWQLPFGGQNRVIVTLQFEEHKIARREVAGRWWFNAKGQQVLELGCTLGIDPTFEGLQLPLEISSKIEGQWKIATVLTVESNRVLYLPCLENDKMKIQVAVSPEVSDQTSIMVTEGSSKHDSKRLTQQATVATEPTRTESVRSLPIHSIKSSHLVLNLACLNNCKENSQDEAGLLQATIEEYGLHQASNEQKFIQIRPVIDRRTNIFFTSMKKEKAYPTISYRTSASIKKIISSRYNRYQASRERSSNRRPTSLNSKALLNLNTLAVTKISDRA